MIEKLAIFAVFILPASAIASSVYETLALVLANLQTLF